MKVLIKGRSLTPSTSPSPCRGETDAEQDRWENRRMMHKGSIVFGKFAMAGNDGIAILNTVTIIETDPDSLTQ